MVFIKFAIFLLSNFSQRLTCPHAIDGEADRAQDWPGDDSRVDREWEYDREDEDGCCGWIVLDPLECGVESVGDDAEDAFCEVLRCHRK